MTKYDLPEILYNSLKDMGGNATIVGVCKYVWDKYEKSLRESGDLFFTWQYDIRWAATNLRKNDLMKQEKSSPRGLWEII